MISLGPATNVSEHAHMNAISGITRSAHRQRSVSERRGLSTQTAADTEGAMRMPGERMNPRWPHSGGAPIEERYAPRQRRIPPHALVAAISAHQTRTAAEG